MRFIISTAVAAGLLSLTMLAGCGDATNEAEADATEAAADQAAADQAAEDEAITLPDDSNATIAKADACRTLAEEADASSEGMAAVQDRWDEAGCETLGDDLAATRAAHPEDGQVALALDYAARPMGE